MESALQFHARVNTPEIPANGSPRRVYVLVEMEDNAPGASAPAHLGLLIDSSDSMRIRLVSEAQFQQLVQRGQAKEVLTDGVPAWQIESLPDEPGQPFPRRIDFVYTALQTVGEYLRPEDSFSLVAFASEAQTVIAPTPGTERARLARVNRQIEWLSLGDGTHIAEGLSAAFQALRQAPERHTPHLILLTDGYTDDVKGCYVWAQRARKMEVPITTIGVGSEFNEDLLINIAETTGANAYYVEDPDQIPAIFHQELHTTLSARYRNLKLRFKPARQVQLQQVYRVLPELGNLEKDESPENGDGAQTVYLGNQARQTLLLEISVPAWAAGTYRAAQLSLTGSNLEAGNDLALRADVVLQVTPHAGNLAPDGHILRILEKVSAYKLGNHALQLAREGAPARAIPSLQQAAARFAQVGEPKLARQMEQLAQSLAAQHPPDPRVTKRLRYETRRITQQLTS